MDFEAFFSIVGTIAFAISGASVGIRKKMDVFGVAMLGMTTSIGGGMIRDLIIGVNPPEIFRDPTIAIISIVVSLIMFIPAVHRKINMDGKILLVMDSVGLALFTVIGVKAGVGFNHLFLTVFIGGITGVGGGVLRDIFAGERPYIFTKHFYACASLIGALVAGLLWPAGEIIAMSVGATAVFWLRILAAKYRWSLPKAG